VALLAFAAWVLAFGLWFLATAFHWGFADGLQAALTWLFPVIVVALIVGDSAPARPSGRNGTPSRGSPETSG
jgi:hypothetical protein